jgi:mannose-6-phosphate isomerase-like protein (cupin superfamily)
MKIPISEFRKKLPLPGTDTWPDGVWDIEAFSHGTMSVVLFAPQGRDYQTFHNQDELYLVLQGGGTLVVEEVRHEFSEGDVLFVPAEKRHHFEDFTTDLATWAIFWGRLAESDDPRIKATVCGLKSHSSRRRISSLRSSCGAAEFSR